MPELRLRDWSTAGDVRDGAIMSLDGRPGVQALKRANSGVASEVEMMRLTSCKVGDVSVAYRVV